MLFDFYNPSNCMLFFRNVLQEIMDEAYLEHDAQ